MATFDIFNLQDNEEENLQPGSIGNIFGRDSSDEILQPRGSPTFTDYLSDTFFQGPARGVGLAAKAISQLVASGIDIVFDTDTVNGLENFFSEGFFKIPETQTTLGDITSTLVQYGVPGGAAAKIAPLIPGLRGLSTFTRLDAIPSIAGKAGEITRRAGYFGAIGGATDFVVSDPETNKTLGEQLDIIEGYQGEDLKGREKAVELIKSKLKFGAEGATIAGAIPLLPVAGTLGFRYGLKPAGTALGYVGDKTIRAVDYSVINPIGSLIAGRKIANIDVPQLIPRAVEKIQAGMDVVGEKTAKLLLPPKDTALGRTIDNSISKFKEWFTSNGGVRPELLGLRNQIFNNADVRGRKAFDTFASLNKTLEDNIIGNYYKVFNGGESQQLIKLEQSKLLDYFNNKGTITPASKKKIEIDPVTGERKVILEKDPITGKRLKEYKYEESEITQKILDSLDPVVSKDVKEYAKQLKQQLLDIQAELRPYVKGDTIKQDFVDYLGTSFKQTLASFNNSRFAFDPIREKGVVNFFRDEWLLRAEDARKPVLAKLSKENKINQDVFTSIKNKNGSNNEILNVNKNNLDEFNKKYNLDLDIKSVDEFKKALTETAENRAKQIKAAAIGTDLDPRIVFSKISTQLGFEGKESLNSLNKLYRKIESLGGKGKTNLSSIVDYLSIPKGADATIKGRKVAIPDSDYSTGILGSILFLNKQEAYRRFFDSLIKLNDNLPVGKKLIYTADEAKEFVNTENLKNISFKNKEFAENVYDSKLLKGAKLDETTQTVVGKYQAAPEIVNALRGTDAVFSGLYDNSLYANFMKLKAVAQVGGTIFSPVAQVRNVTGNAFIALVNGLYGGSTSLKDSFKIITQDIFKGAKINPKALQDKIDDLIRRGIIDQNVQVQELKQLFDQANKGKISLETFMNNEYVKKAIDIYQGADSGWKIFADSFYQDAFGKALRSGDPALLKKGTPAYDNFIKESKDWYRTVAKQEFDPTNYLTGLEKTPLDIVGEMSSFLVRNTMPTYSMVPKAVRGLRNLPIGNFVSFPAEILRNSANIIAIGARELTSTNPFIRQMGARRLIGASAGFGGLGYTVQKTAEALTGVDEEKMEAYQRSFAPSYQKNSTLVPVTTMDENGNFKYYNFSYTNPYDTLLRPINAVLNAFADGSLNNESVDKIIMNALFGVPGAGRSGAIGEFFSPFVDESIGTERVFDIIARGGVKREGGKVFYPQDDINTVISKSIQHIAGGVVPGAVRSAQRIWEGATGKFTDAGTIRDMGTEFTAITTGVRIEDAKPFSSMPFIVTSYNKDKQNVDKKFAEIAYRPSATAEQRLDAYRNYLVEAYDSQNRMYQVIQDGLKIGLDERDLKEVVQNRLNNKKETESLFNGTYKVPTYNEKAFGSMIKRLERENPSAAIKVDEQVNTVKQIFNDLNRTFQNFDLGGSKDGFENILDRELTPGVREIRIQPRTFNILPTSSSPTTPGVPFTINTPQVSANIIAVNQQQQQQQQQQPQTFGERFALLIP
jgi:hypothetical protein